MSQRTCLMFPTSYMPFPVSKSGLKHKPFRQMNLFKKGPQKDLQLIVKKRKSWKMDVQIDRLCTSEIWCPMPDNLPKISLPRAWYPPITNTCEWSAVETIRVSSGLVNSMAVSMAASNVSTSCKAALALLAWWPWSIRPPITTYSVVKSYSSFHTNQVTWFCKACRASY